MDLSKLKVRVKNKNSQRRGRGTGCGRGKTSGRGHKGSGQRKGKVLPYAGYGGDNIPFFRRIPKRGFNSPRERCQIVNLKDIARKIKDASLVTPEVLREVNLIKNIKRPVKILGDIKKSFFLKATFKADKFSSAAKEIIEKAGGTVEYLSR